MKKITKEIERSMSEKQIRKFLFAFIAAVLTVSVILTFYPADLIRAPFIDLVNAVRADGEEDGEADIDLTEASDTEDEADVEDGTDITDGSEEEQVDPEEDDSGSDVELADKVFENDDIIVEGMLPADAIIEAERVEVTIGGKDAIIAYDINIYANAEMKELGIKWQPEDDPLTVTFKSKLITADAVDVYHMEDVAAPADLIESNVATDDNQVVFEAESFSIYAIVEHEGDEEIVTPRFTIRFLAPVTDIAAQETEENGNYYYTVAPYEFLNKAGTTQNTQIVQNGESLEMIANPPNLPGEYFFGWYVVNPATREGSAFKFSWPESPKKIAFETPITVTDNHDGTFTMSWTIDGRTYTESAAYDTEDYSAHIYVAPIYEDYCFVNFHELAYAVSNTSNLLTRKLVILGSDETERVLISDVSAPATDTIRKIFRGWQYRTNNTWISVQTMDNNANPIPKYIDVTNDTDLYPYFQEGRWLYFNVGDSGNGATYVPAQFTLAEFNSEGGEASVGGEVTSLPVTSRVGYDFGGWRVITGYTSDDEPIYELVTDPDGNFLSSVNLSYEEEYEDNDGNTQTGVAYTIQSGKLTIKYPLSTLTFYAQWNEKANAKYTVIVWKQKETDEPNVANGDKHYDYYILPDSISPTVNSPSGLTLNQLDLSTYRNLTTNSATRSDFKGFHLRTTDPAEMSTEYVRGDGSTVVNIYYDRNVHTLTFRPTNGNTTIRTITALYEHSISSFFPIVGTNGTTYNNGERWNPQNSSIYDQVLVYIDIMPDEDITFRLSAGTASSKNIHYYIEPLPGEAATGNTRTYNGVEFVEYKSISARYSFFTEAEDYIELKGFHKSNSFTPQAYNSGGAALTSVWNNNNAADVYCYYLRDTSTFSFKYNYPLECDMVQKTVDVADVPYEAPLSTYYFTPLDSEAPAHYMFVGWFQDREGTKEFDFTETMPAADKIAYGHWEPVYYNVLIDPNGAVIDHINYTEPVDGQFSTFYLEGFTGANSTDEKWIAAWNANGDTIGTMPSWATTLSNLGSGHNTSQSTYFSALYGRSIGEYELERTYVEYNGTDDGTKYYYVNMQFNSTSGEWGVHADIRNALYLTSDQLEAYYKYCRAAEAWHEAARPGYYDGTIPATFEEFKSLYVKKNGQGNYQLYEEVPSGSYAFVGWYRVNDDGTLSDSPYNFNNVIEEGIKLRAVWRRVGSYYISYDPTYILALGNGSHVVVNGEIVAWTDPVNGAAGKYNDGAVTTTLQQPTGITVNGMPAGDDYIFRGWQVVDFLGYDSNGHAIYSPKHDVYYAEPTMFIIDSTDADPNGCIHMQAVYQAVNESDRRPEVANLVLNANDGYLVDGTGNELTSNIDITSASGYTGTGVVVEDAGENEIVFGNMQSNNAVHVYKYAVTPGTLDSPYDQSGNYFKHELGYFLLGFDEGSDYSLSMTSSSDDDVRTGDPFVPTYTADSVISVQRTDDIKLYAVWEPMVYVDFTNRTSQPVTFEISGEGDSMSIVNERTGVFSREKFTETSVTLQSGETIKFVVPLGSGHHFTVSGTNTNTAQLLNISSWFDGVESVNTTAGRYRSSGADYTLTDVFRTHPDGVHVYFDGIDTIFYDVNNGTWTDTARTGSSYTAVAADDSLIYVDEDGLPYEPADLNNGNTVTATKPTDPVRDGYIFVGWTADPEAASCDPADYTLPGTDSGSNINNMTIIKRDKLWNFSTEISEGMTLYAVWGELVTVRFHLYNGNQHWNETDNEYFVPGANYTYTVTLAKGDILRAPSSPTWNTTNQFYRWANVNSHQSAAKTIDQITNVYEFGTPVLNNRDLYTSWINANHIDVTVSKTVTNGDGSALTASQTNKEFTFTAEYTTVSYTGSVTRSGWFSPSWSTSVASQTPTNESQTFTLKDGESVTLPLYFIASASTPQISSNTTQTVSLFFQSVRITEVSDPDYVITVSVNGQPATLTDNGYVTTLGAAPTNSNWSYTGNNNSRTYTLTATPAYSNGTTVPVGFVNTLTNTDVTLTKEVTLDDYITGDEEFSFDITYEDADGNPVTPPAQYQTATLKDGESVVLRGVPIGGSITITENAPGWTAVSSNDNDSTDTGDATFTLSDVPSEGGAITFTNTRNTSDITVSNNVLPEEYGSKTKMFTYTATLWNGGTQVAFPGSITDVTFTDSRKVMTFMLKDDESYVISDIPNGFKLVVIQTEEEDYTTANGLTGETKTDGLEYALANISDDSQIEFENTLKTGSITVTKSVQLAPGQSVPAGTTFLFTGKILPVSDAIAASSISSEFAAELAASGATVSGNTFTFNLADGEDITLNGIPVGYFLQLKETAPGFAAYVNNIRTDAVTVLISETDNSDINYINRIAESTLKFYKVDEETGDPVEGAVFRLYKMNGQEQNTLHTMMSDADGLLSYMEAGDLYTEVSLENGTYYLVEDTPVTGYERLTDTLVITVDNTLTGEDRVTISGCDAATITDYTSGTFTVTITNRKANNVAPTGITFHTVPFALMLALGVILIFWNALDKKKKREVREIKGRGPVRMPHVDHGIFAEYRSGVK